MPPALRITLLRHFTTDIDTLIRAWTQAPTLARWWSTPEQQVILAEVVARPGGPFQIITHSAHEGEKIDRGRFREVLPRDALVIELSGLPDRVLTLQFWPLGDQVELTLTERPFADLASRDAREAAWIAGLDRLRLLVEDPAFRP